MSSHKRYTQAFWLLTTPDQVPHHICRVPQLMSSDAALPAPGQEESRGEVVEKIGSVDVFVEGLDDKACTRVSLHNVRLRSPYGDNFLVIPKERLEIIGQGEGRTDRPHVQFVDDSGQTIRCKLFAKTGSDSMFAVGICDREECRKDKKGHVSRISL